MNIFSRRKILKSTNALDLIPLRAVGHTEEEGRVILFVPKFTGRFIHTLFPVTEKLFFRIRLDDNGTKVWNAVDGIRSTAEIAELLMPSDDPEMKTLTDHQDRLLKFISTLYEREYISFRQIMMSG